MNAETPATGSGGVLKSLNCDRAYGLALLLVAAGLGLLELGGDPVRNALGYDRDAIAGGEWWRLISAHFVHLDAEHTVLNALGVVLMWALFARDYPPLRWLAIYLFAAASVSAGLWFFSPEVEWYVGSSGALHGVMAAGTLAHLVRRDLDGWILAAFIVGKLSYEQIAGQMPFAGTSNTIVDAHLYGAIGGLACAALLVFVLKRRPQSL
jgi:rhomboid family GlyGly-CTERM serine protease